MQRPSGYTCRRSTRSGLTCVGFARLGFARVGFTLVELLVVIAIIGVLVGLLMPAVNIAREKGRMTTCMNNEHQLALAYKQHEATYGVLAGGGWGWGWGGDPDATAGIEQPGGWIYNILPFIDQKDLHDTGKNSIGAVKLTANTNRMKFPISITNCPTRRKSQAFAYAAHGGGTNYIDTQLTMVGRSDYASNGGDIVTEPGSIGIWNSNNCGNPDCGPATQPTMAVLTAAKKTIELFGPTGIDYPMCALTAAKITDGETFTYLLGEKSINPDNYLNGVSAGDNESELVGHNADISRWTYQQGPAMPLPPLMDRKGADNYNQFGSAHASGLNMAFCDGNVRTITYSIDPIVHQQLSNRKDGKPTHPEQLGIF